MSSQDAENCYAALLDNLISREEASCISVDPDKIAANRFWQGYANTPVIIGAGCFVLTSDYQILTAERDASAPNNVGYLCWSTGLANMPLSQAFAAEVNEEIFLAEIMTHKDTIAFTPQHFAIAGEQGRPACLKKDQFAKLLNAKGNSILLADQSAYAKETLKLMAPMLPEADVRLVMTRTDIRDIEPEIALLPHRVRVLGPDGKVLEEFRAFCHLEAFKRGETPTNTFSINSAIRLPYASDQIISSAGMGSENPKILFLDAEFDRRTGLLDPKKPGEKAFQTIMAFAAHLVALTPAATTSPSATSNLVA